MAMPSLGGENLKQGIEFHHPYWASNSILLPSKYLFNKHSYMQQNLVGDEILGKWLTLIQCSLWQSPLLRVVKTKWAWVSLKHWACVKILEQKKSRKGDDRTWRGSVGLSLPLLMKTSVLAKNSFTNVLRCSVADKHNFQSLGKIENPSI